MSIIFLYGCYCFLYFHMCIGGTVDITVYEVAVGGGLRELYTANGGDWGGTYVDKAFRYTLVNHFFS